MKSILTAAIILVSILLTAQNSKKILIENVTIVPTHINQSFKNKDVILNEGKIERIRKHIENDTLEYSQRINGEGKFLMSSMVDAHAHFPEKEYLETYFLMNLLHGVGTLRSMRGEDWHLEIDKKGKFTPELILGSPPIRRSDSLEIKKQDDLVKSYAENGFDFVKILSITTEEQFNALIESANKHDIKVAGHCFRPVNFMDALATGRYETIEHFHGIAYLRELADINKAVELTLKNNVAYCPTTDWYAMNPKNASEFKNRKGVEYVNEDLVKEWDTKIDDYSKLEKEEFDKKVSQSEAWFNYRLNLTEFAYREGINLLIGPDLTGIYGIPGFGYVNELKHFSKAGVSNRDILKAASYNMALLRGEEEGSGTIKVGVAANLVLLSEDPIENIEHSTEIDGIFIRGNYITKAELLKKLKKAPKLKLEH